MSENTGYGTLYICPTPIGNMGDITLRTLDTLKSVDIIACEDTRQTAKLTSRYDIHATLTSYHEHNKASKGEKLINQLLEGKNIALVSDAGMPGISDPGEDIIGLCIENGIEYTVLPGASAAVTALVMSGISSARYVFEGFLPKAQSERSSRIAKLALEERTIVLYESPHHLVRTLKEIKEAFSGRKMTIIREISKKFEEKIYTDTKEALSILTEDKIKGEFVLVIEGMPKEESDRLQATLYEDITLDEHMYMYLDQGIDKKEAMKMVAKDRNMSKRDVYQRLLGR